MSGGGKTPKVQETAAERQAALGAQQRWNERVEDGYLNLERASIDSAMNDDYTELFAGRNSADVARAERQAYTAARPTARSLGTVANTIGEADVLGKTDAALTGLQLKDTTRLDALKRGNDLQNNALNIGDTQASMAGERALNKVQNQILVDNSKTQAMLDAAGGAIQGYSMKKAGYSLDKGGVRTPPSKTTGKAGRSLGWTPILQGL